MEGAQPSRQLPRCEIFASRTLIGLLGVAVGILVARPVPLGGSNYWMVQAASLLLVGLGLALRAWAVAYAGHHTRSNTIEAPQLVTDGPYAHVRNPIYLGTILLGLGMVGLLGNPWLLPIYIITLTALLVAIIPAEEAFLQRQFGEEYSRYRASVRRLLPQLRAWKGARPKTPDWSSARGEFKIAALLVGILILFYAAAILKSRL